MSFFNVERQHYYSEITTCRVFFKGQQTLRNELSFSQLDIENLKRQTLGSCTQKRQQSSTDRKLK